MATPAAATSAVSRVSSGSDQSNRRAACPARSTSRGGDSSKRLSVPIVAATNMARSCVREAGLGLPVTTAIRMALPSGRSAKFYNSDCFNIQRKRTVRWVGEHAEARRDVMGEHAEARRDVMGEHAEARRDVMGEHAVARREMGGRAAGGARVKCIVWEMA